MPLTTQLNQSTDSSRAIDPGPQSNSLASLVSGLGSLGDTFRQGSETVRNRESADLRDKIAVRTDARNQESHDISMLSNEREEQFRTIQGSYLEDRERLRNRLEQGDISDSTYELHLRNVIEKTNTANPGFRDEILGMTTTLGDDQVAHTEAAILAEQAVQEVESVARMEALYDSLIVSEGLGGLPRDEAVRQVQELMRADHAMQRETVSRQLIAAKDSTAAAANESQASARDLRYITTVNEYTSSRLSNIIGASNAVVRDTDPLNPEAIASSRDMIDAVEMRIIQDRVDLVASMANQPEPVRTATLEYFDLVTAAHSNLHETFGEVRTRLISDIVGVTELDLAGATVVLDYLRERFTPDEMIESGFFGADGVPSFILDRARAEVLGATDPAALQASRRSEIAPALYAGRINAADLTNEDAIAFSAESREAVSFGSRGVLSGEGGTVSPAASRIYEDGIAGVVAVIDALPTANAPPRTVGVFTTSLTSEGSLAALHALNGDTAYSDRAGPLNATYRRGVVSLLDATRQQMRPNQFRYNTIEVGEDGLATVITRTPDALSTPGLSFGSSAGLGALNDGQRADKRQAEEFAANYNALVDTLVDTDQYSESAAFRETTVESRRAYWASLGRADLRDEEGVARSPREEQRAVHREREDQVARTIRNAEAVASAARNAAPAEAVAAPAEAVAAPAEAANTPDPAFSRAIEHEGGSQSTGYIPTEGSGVTIAAGLDLGQWTEASLRNLGISEETIAVLSPYMGFTTRSQVEEAQLRPQDLQLTPAQETEINEAVLGNSRDRAQSTPIWGNLGEEGQAQLVSLRHWAGHLLEPDNSKLQGPSGTNELIGVLDNPEATEAEMLSALQRILSVKTEGTAAYNRIERIIEEMQSQRP